MLKIKTCPTCGSGRIKRVCRDLKREAHGEKYVVRGVAFHECPQCGEKVYDRDAIRKIQASSPAYARSHV